jgi:transposase-like protein
MKVINNLQTETINKEIEKGVAAETAVLTDASTSYNQITSTVNHTAVKVNKANINKILPWVHTAISNAKRLLLDVHHRIDDDFLQSYLNEFCYKFNRRYFGKNLMERLIITSVSYRWNQF